MLPKAWLSHLHPLRMHPSRIHHIATSVCKQIWYLKRRKKEAEPISQSQHQTVLTLPGSWASRLPSHQILPLCRPSLALLFTGAVEGACSQRLLVAVAHIQPPLQPMQPSGKLKGKLLLLW